MSKLDRFMDKFEDIFSVVAFFWGVILFVGISIFIVLLLIGVIR